jgi:magnesium chelatase family protein
MLVEQPDLTAFGEPGEASAPVRERVLAARERQRARSSGARPNADLSASEIAITDEVERLLADAGHATGLSGRGRERTIRLARTIADLDHSAEIRVDDVQEAFALRRREPG